MIADIRHDQFLDAHFRGVTETGIKFVYCPIGRIASYYHSDYDHKWCAYCSKYYDEDPIMEVIPKQ